MLAVAVALLMWVRSEGSQPWLASSKSGGSENVQKPNAAFALSRAAAVSLEPADPPHPNCREANATNGRFAIAFMGGIDADRGMLRGASKPRPS